MKRAKGESGSLADFVMCVGLFIACIIKLRSNILERDAFGRQFERALSNGTRFLTHSRGMSST